MSDEEATNDTRLLRQEVDQSIIRARQAKSQYQQAAASGSVPPDVEQLVRDCAIELYNTLRWWRHEDKIEEVWEESDLDTFGALLKKRYETSQQSNPRLSAPGDRTTALAISQVPASQLIGYIDSLLEVARDLGFAPATDKPTTQTEITDEMIEEVEEWRQAVLE